VCGLRRRHGRVLGVDCGSEEGGEGAGDGGGEFAAGVGFGGCGRAVEAAQLDEGVHGEEREGGLGGLRVLGVVWRVD
jgi:hypothetical protein